MSKNAAAIDFQVSEIVGKLKIVGRRLQEIKDLGGESPEFGRVTEAYDHLTETLKEYQAKQAGPPTMTVYVKGMKRGTYPFNDSFRSIPECEELNEDDDVQDLVNSGLFRGVTLTRFDIVIISGWKYQGIPERVWWIPLQTLEIPAEIETWLNSLS